MEKEKISKEAKQLLKNDEFKKRLPRLRTFLEAIYEKKKTKKEITLTDIIEDHYSEKLDEIIGVDDKQRFLTRHRPQISRTLKELEEDWGLIVKSLSREDGKVKIVKLTHLGEEILDYDNKNRINILNPKINKKKKTQVSTKEEIPISAIDFHSTKLRKLVVNRLLNDFPTVDDNGISNPSIESGLMRYAGEVLPIEIDEVLYEDFVINHLEFTTLKEFNTLLNKFKKIANEYWKMHDTIVEGVKLDLKHYLEIPYSHKDNKPDGFTRNLINWVIEGLKCYTDPSCYEHYFTKYFIEEINSKVEESTIRGIQSLEYRSDRECWIFIAKGDTKQKDFKNKMDEKLRNYMTKKFTRAPYYQPYFKKKDILFKAEELRKAIIKILKKNQQVPLYRVGKCPYLKVIVPDIKKRK